MNAHFHLKTIGFMLLLLAFLHLFFPRRFGWGEELRRLSLLTRQIFLVHFFFIVLILAMFGSLSLFATDLLLETRPLNRLLLASLAFFWIARLFIQLFVYEKSLWRGNRFNTIVHILFTFLWSYFAGVYAYCAALIY